MPILAVYPAHAIAELMLEAAKEGSFEGFKSGSPDENRKAFESAYLADLLNYLLIEAIRIHDFHRFGCVPQKGFFLGGPIKIKGGKGEQRDFPLNTSGGILVQRLWER